VVQTPCAGFADQMWFIVPLNNNRFHLTNYNSHKNLLVRGHDQNAPAVQFTWLDYADQQWF
jgi:hypothetical protein